MIDDPRDQPYDGPDPATDPVVGPDPALTALLATFGDRLRQAPDELTVRRHLEAIHAAQSSDRSLVHISAAGSGKGRRRREAATAGRRRRAGLAASLTSGVAATAVALALIGMLPAPVQRLAAETVARVGIELPGADQSRGSPTEVTKTLETPVPDPSGGSGASEDVLRPAPPAIPPGRPATRRSFEIPPPADEFRPEFDRPLPRRGRMPTDEPRDRGVSDQTRPDTRRTGPNDAPVPTRPRDAGTSKPAPGPEASPTPDERNEEGRAVQAPIPSSGAADDVPAITPPAVPPVDAPGEHDEAADSPATVPARSASG